MTSPAALGQSLSLWARPPPLIQNQKPNRFPAGIASRATPIAGCEPVPSMSHGPPHPTLSPPIPPRSPSRPATVSDAPGLAFGFLPAGQCPAVRPANPTVSATPTTARAIAADSATPPDRLFQIAFQSDAPSRPKLNSDRALPRSPWPHTTATDATHPATGSSYAHNCDSDIAAPKSRSNLHSTRTPDGCRIHVLPPLLNHPHRGLRSHIVYRIAAEALQPRARPHSGRRVARHRWQGCVE